MSEKQTFIDACLAGEADSRDIDDWIDRWHSGEVADPSLSLDEFLGFTPDEAKVWAARPNRLDSIISARRGLHLIYTDYGEEYSPTIESPQVPDLVGGRATFSQLVADTDAILHSAGVERRVGDPGVYLHLQYALVDPFGHEYLVRSLAAGGADPEPGDAQEARTAAFSRLYGSVVRGTAADELDRQPQLATSERLLIAVTYQDTVEWIGDQLGEGGRASLTCYMGQDAILTIPFADGSLGSNSVGKLDALGLNSQSTFGQMADKVIAAEAHELYARRDVKPAEGEPKNLLRGVTKV